MKVGRKLGYPEKKTRWQASENATILKPEIQVPTKTETRTLALVADAWQVSMLTITPDIVSMTVGSVDMVELKSVKYVQNVTCPLETYQLLVSMKVVSVFKSVK